MKYVQYLEETGEILGAGTCSETATPPGVWLAVDDLPSGLAYVQDGGVVAMPTRPSLTHLFDWGIKQWYDSRTLKDLQDAKWAIIKVAREAAIGAPLPTPHGTFDADARARTSITDAVLMLKSLADLGTPTTIDFTLADNSVVTLTTAQMVEVGLLLGQQVQAAYTRARDLRTQIEAATTAAEVDAVEW